MPFGIPFEYHTFFHLNIELEKASSIQDFSILGGSAFQASGIWIQTVYVFITFINMLSLILQVKNQQLIGSEITQSLLHKMAHKLQLQGKFPRVQVQWPKLERQKHEKREGRNSAPYIYQAVLIFGTLVFPISVLSFFVLALWTCLVFPFSFEIYDYSF